MLKNYWIIIFVILCNTNLFSMGFGDDTAVLIFHIIILIPLNLALSLAIFILALRNSLTKNSNFYFLYIFGLSLLSITIFFLNVKNFQISGSDIFVIILCLINLSVLTLEKVKSTKNAE